MRFIKSKIKDCVEIIPKKISDNRGYFQRVFCSDLFRGSKLNYHVYQINNSYSNKKGTTRGLHYQTGFHSETKIMKCISGKLDFFGRWIIILWLLFYSWYPSFYLLIIMVGSVLCTRPILHE